MSLEVPKLNVPGWEPRLEAFLKEAKSLLLQKNAGVDSGGTTEEGSVDTSLPFAPIEESTATLLVDQGTGTEGAWTSIASGAASGARWAILQFSFLSTDGNTNATMKYRSASGAQEITAGVISPGTGDAEANRFDPILYVTLSSTGSFDYNVTLSAGDGDWSITRIGYIV